MYVPLPHFLIALQDLHEYLKHLVEAISISPSNESMLRNPQVVLDAALTSGEEDPTAAVEKVTFRVNSLSAKVKKRGNDCFSDEQFISAVGDGLRFG